MNSLCSSTRSGASACGCASSSGRASKVPCAAAHPLGYHRDTRNIPRPDKRVQLSHDEYEVEQPYQYLNRGKEEISEYCLHKAKGADWDECMVVWDDVMQQSQENKALLEDPERAEEAREKLRALDQEIYNLYNRQPIRGVVKSLAAHKRQREQYAARRAAEARGEVVSTPSQGVETDSLAAQRRERLRAVFDQMDKNKDGCLSIMEFREALDVLGSHLDGQTVMKIIGVLGLEGRMDFDDFVAVVEVHCINNESSESKQMRKLLHSHSHAEFRKWVHSW